VKSNEDIPPKYSRMAIFASFQHGS